MEEKGCSERLRPKGRRSLHTQQHLLPSAEPTSVQQLYKRTLMPSPTCALCHHIQQTTTFMANFPSYRTKALLL